MVKTLLCSLLLLLGGTPLLLAENVRLQDPLRPISYATPQAETVKPQLPPEPEVTWQLSAVLVSPARLVAVLNGRSVQVGDQISGFRVAEISRDRVILRRKKQRKIVHRETTGLKKPATGIDPVGEEGSSK